MSRMIHVLLGLGLSVVLIAVVNAFSSSVLQDANGQVRHGTKLSAMTELITRPQGVEAVEGKTTATFAEPSLDAGKDAAADILAEADSKSAMPAEQPELLAQSTADVSHAPQKGGLLMIDHSLHPEHKLVHFDLETSEISTIFRAPEHGWIYQFDRAPNGTQIALAYAAPPLDEQMFGKPTIDVQVPDTPASKTPANHAEDGERQPYDRSGIYTLSLTAPHATPELLFGADEPNGYYFNPIWSADARSIYYISYKRIANLIQSENDGNGMEDKERQNGGQAGAQPNNLDVALYRYDIVNGDHHFIAQDAIWPRLSPDGVHLVHIQVDPATNERGLSLLDTDTGRVTELVEISRFFDIDTPHFSPNGEWIYFGAVAHSTKVSQQWWEQLLNIKVAHAHTDHNVPSDWWRVPIQGGEPERVTSTRRVISYGDFNNDGRQLYSATDTGIYLMTDSGEYIERLPLPNLYRFMLWLE